MRNLQTARVVIIDDDIHEAMPVIQSLGRLGIGCVYIPGDKVEELPKIPLSGIRLVFIDMQLGTAGTEKQVGSQTASVFAKVIATGNEPTIVVLWTKHPDYVDAFKTALFDDKPSFRSGLLVSRMDKPTDGSKIDINTVLERIELLLSKYTAVQAVWKWEQLTHDAVTDTTKALAKIVSKRAQITDHDTDDERIEKWIAAILHIFRSLIQASAGKNIYEEAAYHDLLQPLIQIIQDRLESNAAAGSLPDLTSVFALKNWNGPSAEERLALNTMLLTGAVADSDTSMSSGNVYVPSKDKKDCCPHSLCGVNRDMLAVELMKLNRDGDYKALREALTKQQRVGPVDDQKIKAAELALENRLTEILKPVRAVMVEVTPGCDYAQRNCRVARFIAGLAMPSELLDKFVDKAESMRVIEPITLPDSAEACAIVLSARFPLAVIDPHNRIKVPPLIRLRTPVFLDLQNWFASQSARFGYMKMEDH